MNTTKGDKMEFFKIIHALNRQHNIEKCKNAQFERNSQVLNTVVSIQMFISFASQNLIVLTVRETDFIFLAFFDLWSCLLI